ncbi:anhydro-N-acetylmuramic acid kinase [Ornithinimicrobium sp. Y1847]|uniref:anhydro-N-acetylmuramic acid kinase n=1 Tax=Ornithinimicrobium sp. Y1847 TaxID=3405419 RepID=UPI003B671828
MSATGSDSLIVIGLGSGTSVDGIDGVALELTLCDDLLRARVLEASCTAYGDGVREQILATFPPARVGTQEICRVDQAVGQAFADAASDLVGRLGEGHADLIASHGQTVFHDVVDGQVAGTLQLGQPAWIAEATGLPVVSDLRVADVTAGGQGAPLASTWDALWLGGDGRTTAALNLGGIANATVVGPDRAPVALDTGPANALMDAAIAWRTEGRQTADLGGESAARGSVDAELLEVLLAEPYYALPLPRTTGKELFNLDHLRTALDRVGREIATDDLLATLAELTARTVAAPLRELGVERVVASGGGTQNPVLMERLGAALPGVEVVSSEATGLDPRVKEAAMFALLGWLSWHGLPGTAPSATGARVGRIAGRITPGHRPLRLPEPLAQWPRRLEVC